MYKVFVSIMLFFIYSFLGWLMEVLVCFIEDKKLVNRGFLIGPVCPIYGVGSLLILTFLSKYKSDPVTLACMSMIICSVLEYLASYIMEKIFKTRWWDYSNRKFNLNGRVCLSNVFAFGILGLLIVLFVNPFFVNIIHLINPLLLKVLGSVLFVLFIIDLSVSTKVIYNIKGVSCSVVKDSTEEVSKKVKEVLATKDIFTRRVMSAFPDFIVKFKKNKDV